MARCGGPDLECRQLTGVVRPCRETIPSLSGSVRRRRAALTVQQSESRCQRQSQLECETVRKWSIRRRLDVRCSSWSSADPSVPFARARVTVDHLLVMLMVADSRLATSAATLLRWWPGQAQPERVGGSPERFARCIPPTHGVARRWSRSHLPNSPCSRRSNRPLAMDQ